MRISSIEDLKKMTRKEFESHLKDYLKENYPRHHCPNELDFKCAECWRYNCVRCWINATKDFKFRGE